MTATAEIVLVSHRLVNLRVKSAGCSCGATYVGKGSADLRAQHRTHKANSTPVVAKKAPARKTARTRAAATPAVKPRAGKAPAAK